MEQIIAAVITAISSIVVAIISNQSKGKLGDMPRATTSGSWWFAISILACWMLFAPNVLRYPIDLIVDAFIAVPIVTFVAAAILAPPPLVAAWSILAMHALNATAMVLTARRGWTLYGPSDVVLLLFAVGLNAALAAMIANWRRRPANVNLSEELERLAMLHKDGRLTDVEYASAKKLLLERTGR